MPIKDTNGDVIGVAQVRKLFIGVSISFGGSARRSVQEHAVTCSRVVLAEAD